MTTRTINVSIINQTISRVPAVVGESGPTLLSEAELDCVAAAGRKPGASGGAGATADSPRPTRPK